MPSVVGVRLGSCQSGQAGQTGVAVCVAPNASVPAECGTSEGDCETSSPHPIMAGGRFFCCSTGVTVTPPGASGVVDTIVEGAKGVWDAVTGKGGTQQGAPQTQEQNAKGAINEAAVAGAIEGAADAGAVVPVTTNYTPYIVVGGLALVTAGALLWIGTRR